MTWPFVLRGPRHVGYKIRIHLGRSLCPINAVHLSLRDLCAHVISTLAKKKKKDNRNEPSCWGGGGENGCAFCGPFQLRRRLRLLRRRNQRCAARPPTLHTLYHELEGSCLGWHRRVGGSIALEALFRPPSRGWLEPVSSYSQKRLSFGS